MFQYQHKNWPNYTWDNEEVLPLLGKVRNMEGRLAGKMEVLGFQLKDEALLETLTLEVVKTSSIEGEILNNEQVRSSLARKLGMDAFGLVRSDRNVDGVVEMILDATKFHRKALSKERLFDWHSSLFPDGKSGLQRITVGKWREDKEGPMQVVSGPMGREKVHFQAPDAKVLEKEMKQFLAWFAAPETTDPVLKAAIAHLWFLTIHPFSDGNGRIARAIADLQLTRADGNFPRFYSMSAQIRNERNEYYSILESTQKGDMDITEWLVWFLKCLYSAITASDQLLARILLKSEFWNKYKAAPINPRQHLMVNKLLDGFEGKLTSSKWATIAKCSSDSALRDIQNLIALGMLVKEDSGGRSTSYVLNFA